jgi:hypothetical protein
MAPLEMDKIAEHAGPVVGELAETLHQLRSAGEIGFLILAVFLLVVIALALVAVFNQRLVIGRFRATAKATEETLKTIDTALKERELGVKERDQQFNWIKDMNTELRTEMTRLRDQQKGLKDSLNATITAGLEDIRDRLTQTSVKEIIAQVPDTFRKDLEAEFNSSLQAAISKINDHLSDKDAVQQYISATTARISAEIEHKLGRYFEHFPPSFAEGIIYRAVLDETRGDRRVAEGVVERLRPIFDDLARRWYR